MRLFSTIEVSLVPIKKSRTIHGGSSLDSLNGLSILRPKSRNHLNKKLIHYVCNNLVSVIIFAKLGILRLLVRRLRGLLL